MAFFLVCPWLSFFLSSLPPLFLFFSLFFLSRSFIVEAVMVIYTIISSELHKIQLNVNLNSKGIYWLMFLAEMFLCWALRLIDWAAHWCYQGPSFFIVAVGSTSFYGCQMISAAHRASVSCTMFEGKSCFSATDWKAQTFCHWISMSQFLAQREACAVGWGLGDWQKESLKPSLDNFDEQMFKNTQC